MNHDTLIQIKIEQSLLKLTKEAWAPLQSPDFPFTDYEFLCGLEKGRCLGERTGWTPLYLTARQDETLVGALILYAKTNSYGEYIFDFNWASAAQASGIAYYPKLISAIPFTPATNSKILTHISLDPALRNTIENQLLTQAKNLMNESEASSLHFLFIPKEDLKLYEKQELFIRHSFQYHWENLNYLNFDDFLKNLKGKRRREIVRERSQVSHAGVKIEWLTGSQLTPEHAEIMFAFYESTIDKKQGFSYLTLEFFKNIFTTMKEKIHFVLARDLAGEPVAGALNFFGSERLFGRYWGCLDEYKSLHFEVCYYQGIEFCMSRELKLFEAGAQGEHKFQRGFLPTLNYSAHQIRRPDLNRAIKKFVEQEKTQLRELFMDYDAHSPFSLKQLPV